MNYQFQIRNSLLLIEFNGDLVEDTIEEEFFEQLDKEGAKTDYKCVVCLAKLRFLNSQGISVLLRMYKQFRDQDGDLVLINLSESIRSLLIITKLDALFTILPDWESAMGFHKIQE